MFFDDDGPGWPAEPTRVRRLLTNQQKTARILNRIRREREARRPQHPYCAQCVCDWCSLRRKVAAE